MATLAPIPVAPKTKSNGGKALQFHNGLFYLIGNINNCFVNVKRFFKNFEKFLTGGRFHFFGEIVPKAQPFQRRAAE